MQNYDQRTEEYNKKKGLGHSHLEKPAMYIAMGDYSNKEVLCVGCGSGEEVDFLSEKAKQVQGIDISSGQIELAKNTFPNYKFATMDMQNLQFPDDSFDIIFSSLTIHYVEDWTVPLKEFNRVLKPGGRAVFSTHHPIAWGAAIGDDIEKDHIIGVKDGEFYGDYLTPRRCTTKLFGTFEIAYYHKPVAEIVRSVTQAGFNINNIVEPTPLGSAKEVDATFYETRKRFPLFIIFDIKKDS